MRTLSLLLVAAVVMVGCATTHGAQGTNASGIQFVENDYPAALKAAREKGLPVFADVWTTWCHTCQSLRAYVFPDRALTSAAKQFIWLSIDAENEKNFAFLEKYPVLGYPTLLVIESGGERPIRRWLGSLTAPELAAPLEEASRASVTSEKATLALAAANVALNANDSSRAHLHLDVALAESKLGSLIHAQAAEAKLTLLSEEKQSEACVALAERELPNTPPGTSLAGLATSALSCALDLPESHEDRKKIVKATVARVVAIISDASVVLLPDDRSGLYETLVYAKKAEADIPGARKAAEAWRDFLEDEAQRATTPAARAVFDPHRFLAYQELKELPKAVPMLQLSQRDFPDDYNPSARLATVLFLLERPREALPHIERAEKLVYGPRTARVMLTKADILLALRDTAGAAKTLDRAEKALSTAPDNQKKAYLEMIAKARQQLK